MINGTSNFSVPIIISPRNLKFENFVNTITNDTFEIPQFSLQGFIGMNSLSMLIFENDVYLVKKKIKNCVLFL
jgi:hypothetical protein